MSNNNKNGAIQILTLVQAYCDLHDEADDHLHEAVWNLTKARRSSRSFAATLPSTEFSASSVRHELSARTRVVRDECFRAVDPKAVVASEMDDSGPSAEDCAAVGTAGLRQRKGKATAPTTTTTMTTEEATEAAPTTLPASEEALLILAGSLPPRELRIAQERARKSLDSYIQAATLIAALQERLA